MNRLSLGLLVLVVCNLTVTQQKQHHHHQQQQQQQNLADCQRIYFEHPADQFHLAHLLNAVYVKTNTTKAGFPVFKDERGDTQFTAYNDDSNNKNTFYISTGGGDNRSAGLVITKITDLGFFVFYDTHTKETWMIHAKCVDFTDCVDKNILFTFRANRNEHLSMNFTPTQIFLNNRRMYKDRSSGAVLFYSTSGRWIITDAIESSIKMFTAKSTAIKPEFITEPWKRDPRRDINTQATIECDGATLKRECRPQLCKNHGVCHRNSQNETWCTCRYGYTGVLCEAKSKQMCPDDAGKTPGDNRDRGAIKITQCSDGSYGTFVCQPQNGGLKQSWRLNCNVPQETVRNRREAITIPRAKKLDKGDAEPAHDYVGVKVLVVIVPLILLPGMHLIVYFAIKTRKLKFWKHMSMQAYVGEWCLTFLRYFLKCSKNVTESLT